MLLRPGPILALMSAGFKEENEEEEDIEKVKRVYIKTMQLGVSKRWFGSVWFKND